MASFSPRRSIDKTGESGVGFLELPDVSGQPRSSSGSRLSSLGYDSNSESWKRVKRAVDMCREFMDRPESSAPPSGRRLRSGSRSQAPPPDALTSFLTLLNHTHLYPAFLAASLRTETDLGALSAARKKVRKELFAAMRERGAMSEDEEAVFRALFTELFNVWRILRANGSIN